MQINIFLLYNYSSRIVSARALVYVLKQVVVLL